jgi:hypothetical protein
MKQVDRKLSRQVAKAIGAAQRSAWRKACLALQLDSDLEDGLYVEGWAVLVDSRLVIEHGWVELNGRIVDPTRWDREVAYFPALRFDKEQVLEALVDCPELPVTWRCGPRLWDNRAYHQAWQEARAFSRSRLVNARQLV